MLATLARQVSAAVGWLSWAAAVVAAVATLACLALVCGVVIARYFFGLVPSWSDEAGGWLVVTLVMLAVGEAQRRGEHIGVDLLLERASGDTRRLLQGFGVFCIGAAAAILLWQGWEAAAFSHMIGARPLSLDQVPLWIIQALVPFGAGLMLLVALAQLLGIAAGEDPLPKKEAEVPRATE